MLGLLGLIISILLNGCAGVNDSMTPNPKSYVSDFDNSIEIVQDNVSAASSLSEGWHVLGFFWTNRSKDTIIVNVGRNGIVSIQGVAFNIDGNIIRLKPVDVVTDFKFYNSGIDWSYKRYEMSLTDFLKLADADTVKMKVDTNSEYTVSTFGKKHPDAIISSKLPKFKAELSRYGIK